MLLEEHVRLAGIGIGDNVLKSWVIMILLKGLKRWAKFDSDECVR